MENLGEFEAETEYEWEGEWEGEYETARLLHLSPQDEARVLGGNLLSLVRPAIAYQKNGRVTLSSK